MPNLLAPKEQTHVPSVIWIGDKISKEHNMKNVKEHSIQPYSQDNLFHTLLGLFEVDSKIYDSKMDILYKDKIEE